jgi:hypothetical protein
LDESKIAALAGGDWQMRNIEVKLAVIRDSGRPMRPKNVWG